MKSTQSYRHYFLPLLKPLAITKTRGNSKVPQTNHHTKHTHTLHTGHNVIPKIHKTYQNGDSQTCTKGAQKRLKKLHKNYTKTTTQNTRKLEEKKTAVDEMCKLRHKKRIKESHFLPPPKPVAMTVTAMLSPMVSSTRAPKMMLALGSTLA